MRQFEEKPSTVTTLVSTQCDICGLVATPDWGKDDPSIIDETKICHRTGESWPDDYMVDSIHIDLCPDCFRNKLVPWINSQRTGEPLKYEST